MTTRTNGNVPDIPKPPSVPIPRPKYWWPGGVDGDGNPIDPVWIPETLPRDPS